MTRLGQHFLKNGLPVKKIATALELWSGDAVIEIGAGHGELTEIIEHEMRGMKPKTKIVAIEKDGSLAEQLRKKFIGVEIVEGDALRALPQLCSKFRASCFKICGNIPYYITGKLLRVIGELKHKPKLCVFTLQREVAERIAAQPPKMNRLAASVQFWAEAKIVGLLSRNDFKPPPEVDSAIIKLETRDVKREMQGANEYYKLVKVLFQQPRKTILNNLAAGEWRSEKKDEFGEMLRKIGVNPGDRPQNLSVDKILTISRLFISR